MPDPLIENLRRIPEGAKSVWDFLAKPWTVPPVPGLITGPRIDPITIAPGVIPGQEGAMRRADMANVLNAPNDTSMAEQERQRGLENEAILGNIPIGMNAAQAAAARDRDNALLNALGGGGMFMRQGYRAAEAPPPGGQLRVR